MPRRPARRWSQIQIQIQIQVQIQIHSLTENRNREPESRIASSQSSILLAQSAPWIPFHHPPAAGTHPISPPSTPSDAFRRLQCFPIIDHWASQRPFYSPSGFSEFGSVRPTPRTMLLSPASLDRFDSQLPACPLRVTPFSCIPAPLVPTKRPFGVKLPPDF